MQNHVGRRGLNTMRRQTGAKLHVFLSIDMGSPPATFNLLALLCLSISFASTLA